MSSTPDAKSRLRRAMLFVPAHSEKMVRKATQLDVDCLIFDLEDAVAPHEKDAARQLLADLLPQLDFGNSERLVRINPPADSLDWRKDVDAVLGCVDGYVMPKAHEASEVAEVASYIAQVGSAGLSFHILIESARGLVNLGDILERNPSLNSIILGAEDLAHDLHMPSTSNPYYIDFPRYDMLKWARVYGVQVIDSVFTDLAAEDGLREAAAHSRNFGFDGKLAIHPKQVATIQQALSPTEQEVAFARRLLAASEGQGGAFAFEGQMIDLPIVLRASAVVAYADRLGV
jgi:citrate lyase beta subunit